MYGWIAGAKASFKIDVYYVSILFQSRNDKRDYAPSRRSKSEGPPGASNKRSYYAAYGSPSPDYADLGEFDTDYVVGMAYNKLERCPTVVYRTLGEVRRR